MSGFRTGILASARKMSTQQHNLVLENMNPCIKKMEYAVRGPLVIRATQIEKVINVQKNCVWIRPVAKQFVIFVDIVGFDF